MVFFNCNACGEALKKNQVDKHVLRCRNCQVLSCVDCGKDFWGNDYQSHTKCMTEDEKYCGQNYVPKVNKGEVKQEQWIEKVQRAIDKSASNPGLKKVLIRLKDYPNIPRKQQKFQNFLKNSLRIYDTGLMTQVWENLMAHSSQDDTSMTKANTQNEPPEVKKCEANGNNTDTPCVQKDALVEDSENINHKKSKREKKEERQNKANKKEKKDKIVTSDNDDNIKKCKKRKHKDEDDDKKDVIDTEVTSIDEQPQKKKKKKSSYEEPIKAVTEDDACENGLTEAVKDRKKKTKFNWELTILKVLQDKGETSIKKLRKKVLNEFATLDAANYSEENLYAKFDKKIRKMPTVQVLKERARLREK